MAARIGQLRLAGIGTGGTITSPTRLPNVAQQLAATGDVLTSLAAGLTDDLTALDKLKSVEIEERFKRNVDGRIAKLNSLDTDFEDQVSNVVEEERAAATETANDTFGTQSELDALQLLLKTQGEGLKTLASTFRRSAISKRGIALYEAASDELLAQVRGDPDGADLFVDAFKMKVQRLCAGMAPLICAKMALELADDAIFAQVEGLALQRRFEEARALADEEAGEFPPERFRTLKRRIREIETQARADDRIANADAVADISIDTTDAENVGDLENVRQRIEADRDDGILLPGQASTAIAAVATRSRAIIKGGEKTEKAMELFMTNRVTKRSDADLILKEVLRRKRAVAEAGGEELTPEAALKTTVYINGRMGILAGTDFADIQVAGRTNDPPTLARGIVVAQEYAKGAPGLELNVSPQLGLALVYADLYQKPPQEAAVFILSRVPDPATVKLRQGEWNEIVVGLDVVSRIQDDILSTGFLPEFLPFGEADALVSAKAQEDYLKMFNVMYILIGDEDLAKEATIRDFRRIYGLTRISGVPEVIRNPIEQVINKLTGGNLTTDQQTEVARDIGQEIVNELFDVPRTPEGKILPPKPGTSAEELQRQAIVIEAGVPTDWSLVSTKIPNTYEFRFVNVEGVPTALVDATGKTLKVEITQEDLEKSSTYQRLIDEQKRAFDHRKDMIRADKMGTEPGILQVGPAFGDPEEMRVELLKQLKKNKEPKDPSTITRGEGGVDASGKLTLEGSRKLFGSANAPPGITSHNPGNIKKTNDIWVGSDVKQTRDKFVTFSAPEWGIRAMATILQAYRDKHELVTVEGIISRWAPHKNKEGVVINDTEAYIKDVTQRTGYARDLEIDVSDDVVMMRLIRAIITHENGFQPYGDDVLELGLTLSRL